MTFQLGETYKTFAELASIARARAFLAQPAPAGLMGPKERWTNIAEWAEKHALELDDPMEIGRSLGSIIWAYRGGRTQVPPALVVNYCFQLLQCQILLENNGQSLPDLELEIIRIYLDACTRATVY